MSFFKILALTTFFTFSSHSVATILPDQYSVDMDLPLNQNRIDKEYKNWLNQVANKSSILILSKSSRQARTDSLDRLEKYYVNLLLLQAKKIKKSEIQVQSKGIETELNHFRKVTGRRHHIEPYIISMVDRLKLENVLSSEFKKRFGIGNSCPEIQLLRETIHHKSMAKASNNTFLRTFDRVMSIEDLSTRRRLNSKLFEKIPLSKKPKFADSLSKNFTDDISSFRNIDLVLNAYVDKVNSNNWEEVLDLYVSRRKCSSSLEIFKKRLRDSDSLPFSKSRWAADKIANCYRKFGKGSRLRSINSMRPSLLKEYKDYGQALFLTLKIRHYWGEDHLKTAMFSVEQLNKLVQKKKLKPVAFEWGRYLSALVHLAQDNPKKAKVVLTAFLDEFPDGEYSKDAKRKLTLLHLENQDWNGVLEVATDLIEEQQQLKQNDRDVAYSGFGLFWSGKAYLELGDFERMKIQWKRLAKEYYSTYYGALGHFLLEKIYSKPFPLQPMKNRKFSINELASSFNSQGKETFDRASLFLSLGLRRKANCEIKNLGPFTSEPEKKLLQATMMNASGDWLSAVRSYVKVPRTVRKTLPLGFERILFPRRFGQKIAGYSRKLGMDSDYVTSLIRQESLFNPRARSAARAYGVMQLIKSTAKAEARKISQEYLGDYKKSDLLKKIRTTKGLYDIETNIALGVHHLYTLMKKNNNVVITLASYNAGPTKVRKWLKKYDTTDILGFVENMPYEETRTYVKLILRNYFYYKKLYEGSDPNFSHLEQVTKPILKKMGKFKGIGNQG